MACQQINKKKKLFIIFKSRLWPCNNQFSIIPRDVFFYCLLFYIQLIFIKYHFFYSIDNLNLEETYKKINNKLVKYKNLYFCQKV
jgi:hypothetical protein